MKLQDQLALRRYLKGRLGDAWMRQAPWTVPRGPVAGLPLHFICPAVTGQKDEPSLSVSVEMPPPDRFLFRMYPLFAFGRLVTEIIQTHGRPTAGPRVFSTTPGALGFRLLSRMTLRGRETPLFCMDVASDLVQMREVAYVGLNDAVLHFQAREP